MTEARCTFNSRPPLQEHMLVARYEMLEANIKLYKLYKPSMHAEPYTSKFYARHDAFNLDNMDDRSIELYNLLVLAKAKGPKSKVNYPETENQQYGWYNGTIESEDKNDKRFFFGRIESLESKLESVNKLFLRRSR